jgi:hypothetical protein
MLVPFLLILGCTLRDAEDPDWYDAGDAFDVDEPIAFTDVPYDFPANDADGIGALQGPVFPVQNPDDAQDLSMTAYAPGDSYGDDADCEGVVDNDLPAEIEGIITLHPRFYFKSYGCEYDDEKYYGSYFIEDRTGGLFVLGDSKVAHLNMGDKVKLNVRGARTAFDLNMISLHDVVEIERGPFPIFYTERLERFEPAPDDIAAIGRVQRVQGIVTSDPDTFGQFTLMYCPDNDPIEEDGNWNCESGGDEVFNVSMDSELSRRKVRFDVGTNLRATGPLMYSYSEFTIAIMRLGQLEVLP